MIDFEAIKLEELKKLILKNDATVEMKKGDVMAAKNVDVFLQDGVFKYAFTMAQNHISFHSMVMYSSPEIYELTKKLFGKIGKLQKGCVNFKNLESIDVNLFDELMQASAKADFSVVMSRYKK
ncbi:MAG: hypothetical protein H6607_06415 [Flavobacteriales bacterium]|nr:hypothetical protein [Flavobacteriales bacterium]